MDNEYKVDSYTIPLDAELAKAYLESYAIPVRLEGDQLSGSGYALGTMFGGIQLFVAQENGERAGQLLAKYHRDLMDQPEVLRGGTPDELVQRAWLAALVGFVTLPVIVHGYSLWLLLQVRRSDLAPRSHWRYTTALLLDVLAPVLAVWLMLRMSS